MNYLILQNPGHNRVYYNSADTLALSELKLACLRLSGNSKGVELANIEGIRYLSFETETELSESDLQIISRLSFVFAIFILEKLNDKNCLIPLKIIDYSYINSKVSSLLKYRGKTNELFTKMMINVALLSSNFTYSEKIKMLDPVAGKGTSLFEAAVYGFDAYGIEIETKFVHEADVFFKKYLEQEHLKHTADKRQIYGASKSNSVKIYEFLYAKNKQEFKTSETVKTLAMVCGNSQDAYKYFKKQMFNFIVGDLPYGIVHGSSTSKKTLKSRNPKEFLIQCLPEWYKVLKKGGTIVIAWNSFIVSREQLLEVFLANKLEVLSQAPYTDFEHMVDKSIKRDIIVAKKL